MAIWLIRAGANGEYEQKFLQEKRVYLTWEGFDHDISKFATQADLLEALKNEYPDDKINRLRNHASQIFPFAHEIKPGDLVVLPLKTQRVICIGEVKSGYHFDASNPDPYYHWHDVQWLNESIPRANFGQDLLYSFGSVLTICRIQRNNAEARLNAMRANGWKAETLNAAIEAPSRVTDGDALQTNVEELARDQLSRLIETRFKGHGLTRLIEAILQASGYTTYMSPEGPDGGVDILAGSGALGFEAPRLCVEVKSGSAPISRPDVDKLLGAVRKFNAQQGLFVSWSGYKSNVQKELIGSFFDVRLWSQNDILEQLFAVYDKLSEDIKAELPLKRVWMVATQDEA